MELTPGAICNVGAGISTGISSVAVEAGILDEIMLTNEQGFSGGAPTTGKDSGCAQNYQALVDQPYQFDFYDGGGLDIAILGMAEADAEGNVNVSKFGPRLAGSGGFINISQSAKKVVFVGTFCSGPCELHVGQGRVSVASDGATKKFVRQVEHRTFSGRHAAARGREVLYVTERCVFRLVPEGLELVEIAPGVDLERDILARMDFRPIVKSPRLMDARIFEPPAMGLRAALIHLPFESRFVYDARRNLLLINFAQFEVRSAETVAEIVDRVRTICEPLGKRVHAIVNYEGFALDRDLEELYVAAVGDLVKRYYASVTRYTTSAFLRAKLGEAMSRRKLAPHIFETEDEALAQIERLRR